MAHAVKRNAGVNILSILCRPVSSKYRSAFQNDKSDSQNTKSEISVSSLFSVSLLYIKITKDGGLFLHFGVTA